MIIGDHIKYTVDPPSAEEPLPKGQDPPAREAHRKAHVALNKGLGANWPKVPLYVISSARAVYILYYVMSFASFRDSPVK